MLKSGQWATKNTDYIFKLKIEQLKIKRGFCLVKLKFSIVIRPVTVKFNQLKIKNTDYIFKLKIEQFCQNSTV